VYRTHRSVILQDADQLLQSEPLNMKDKRGVLLSTSFGLGRDLYGHLLRIVRIEYHQVQMVEDRCILGTREEEGLSLTPLLMFHP